MKFKFMGEQATFFTTGNVGEVQFGDEFEVPDDLAPRFEQHPLCKRVRERAAKLDNEESKAAESSKSESGKK